MPLIASELQTSRGSDLDLCPHYHDTQASQSTKSFHRLSLDKFETHSSRTEALAQPFPCVST